MRRRGFLKRFFGGDDHVELALFAVQLIVREYASRDLRNQLHAAIAGHGSGEPTPEQRRADYLKVVGLLAPVVSMADYGFWEYETRPARARESFDTWVTELEEGMAEETETAEAALDTERVLIEKTYIAISLVFLVRFPIPVCDEYDDDEPSSWRRYTFADLLRAIERFDFAHVEADAAFVMPGSDDDGLSELDLADEGWEPLKPLTG